MKGILLLNGEPYENLKEEENALVYCCDGAYLWAKDKIHIDENIGDFDSLQIEPIPKPKEVYPEEKDYTDGEIAMRQLIKAGADDIVIYGAGGKREDHFFGNLHIMYYAFQKGVRCRMVTNYSEMFFADGKASIACGKGKTISLIPFFGDVTVNDSYGLYYPLSSLTLLTGTCRGISNLATEDEVGFTCNGTLLVCIDAKKKGEIGG